LLWLSTVFSAWVWIKEIFWLWFLQKVKSRIIAAIALLILLLNIADNVHFLSSNKQLMERDFAIFKMYLGFNYFTERAHFHHSLDFAKGPKVFILIDEIDYILFHDPS
jgi:hypothetical protein